MVYLLEFILMRVLFLSMSKIIKELFFFKGMNKLWMNNYYVMSNCMCEWFICILLDMFYFF